MRGRGYSYVLGNAYMGFEPELETGAWKDIDISSLDNPGHVIGPDFLAAPMPVVCKVVLFWAIGDLRDALGSVAVDELDAKWDASQRRLHHRLAIHMDDDSAPIRQAAQRLHGVLLLGGGTAQTQLEYEAEVDFGRKQREVVKAGQPAADVALLKLHDVLKDIDVATEALAAALGRAADKPVRKGRAPSTRQREALAGCSAAFNEVHELLGWARDRAAPGLERDRLDALLAPMEALLARNPGYIVEAPAPAEPAAASPAAPSPSPPAAKAANGA